MLVVIPCAGAGKRFSEKGYTFPKFLLTIRNRPMLQWVVENLHLPEARHIFVVNPEDYARYDLSGMVSQLTPYWQIEFQTERTGAAAAVLLGLKGQDLNQPLLIANCDQWLEWSPKAFWNAQSGVHDALVPVFSSTHPKWSYAKTKEALSDEIIQVAEKRVISNWATAGLYLWKSAQRFKDCAETMMQDAEKQVNGEWFVCPVLNELIKEGGTVLAYRNFEMYGLGTPEDLEEFKMAVCSGMLDVDD